MIRSGRAKPLTLALLAILVGIVSLSIYLLVRDSRLAAQNSVKRFSSTSWRTTSPTPIETQQISNHPQVTHLATTAIGRNLPTQQELTMHKLYADPAGHFTVRLPVDWQRSEDGSYVGSDGYFRTGYLPEMGYMGYALRVCERLANSVQGPVWRPSMYDMGGLASCSLRPLPGGDVDLVRIIVKNPAANPDERYFYMEADAAHIEGISDSLQILGPERTPAPFYHRQDALRPEDEAFWAAAVSLPDGWNVEEYPLVSMDHFKPGSFNLNAYLPADVLKRRSGIKIPWEDRLAQANEVLSRFGYSLQPSSVPPAVLVDSILYKFYHGDEMLVDKIRSYSSPITNQSDDDFFMLLYTTDHRDIAVGGTRFELWRADPFEYKLHLPVYHGDDLLIAYWEPELSQIQIRHGEEVVFAIAAVMTAVMPLDDFWSWDGHWMMEADGFLIQDGVILNERMGYEEIFNWQLREGKPFYIFRNGPRVGISYAGEILPLVYDEIYHYGCCGLTHFNPTAYGGKLWFYALRDGFWYYVGMGKPD